MTEYQARQKLTDGYFNTRGTPDAAPARISLVALDDPSINPTYFLMRGIDSGTGTYVTWVVSIEPDKDGTQATSLNTNPPLVGSIQTGSGIVLYSWII